MSIIKNKISSIFIQHAIPSVLGMLAISSATIVDGLFVGNYVGTAGLAAINLSMPIFTLLFGIALMLAIGSSVISGKLMGERDNHKASIMFTKSIISIVLLSIVSSFFLYINIDHILQFFKASNQLYIYTSQYLSYMLIFIPFLMTGITFSYFVKIDNRPNLAFGALLLSSLVNIILDWLLIVYLNQGIEGAAIATGISQVVVFIVLITHFFSKDATIKFVKPIGSWIQIIKATNNGFSEFVNEISIGITTLMFNFIMIKTFGVDGVAAYTVVNYILWISIMASYGISSSLQPIVSQNFGAKEFDRITQFLKLSFFSVTSIGFIVVIGILVFPENLIDLFLEQKEINTINIILEFLSYIWPAFIFSGISLVISAYFTSIHKPFPSTIIALSRSLILPILFIVTLPLYLGNKGIYLVIPASEFFTFILAIYLYKFSNKKEVKIQENILNIEVQNI